MVDIVEIYDLRVGEWDHSRRERKGDEGLHGSGVSDIPTIVLGVVSYEPGRGKEVLTCDKRGVWASPFLYATGLTRSTKSADASRVPRR